ncbi:MAG: alpha/beta fold hydrolase [Candidatus Thiodiazotropha endolucinida]|nr:alpha/beta fold hydrolase [Candidatus Thiodiazotropha taylori]MCG8054947.1 alpha/beta fold hydrolase [Candidatus Thiodiazotropha taylori]MCW4316775.1 alpha/beta fold hydrolase [Candidatus Thiodiazotropha taylori]MCW4322426.1 alpha/beta fold hydrolase [Candidatus Thiodiazotropha taylori]
MKTLFFYFLSKIVLITLVFSTPASALFTDRNSLPENKEIVVLLHGLGRNKTSMWLLASRLENAGYYVKRVEYSSLDHDPDEILQDISSQINQCCQKHTHSVHFVGHSLGGLMVRAYLQYNKVDKLGRVVLLGTPNKGTEAADHFSNSWLMEILGPTAKALGTGQNSFPNSLKAPYYPVGIIAGEIKSRLNDPVIPGKDDGLVSIEATKIDGMTDFIIIETGHSSMRYNSEVAEQTIEFIKNGMFKTK